MSLPFPPHSSQPISHTRPNRMAAPAPKLPEELYRIIHGHVDHEEKKQHYQESLQKWWKDYSHRKNDEEDMVADSLLYDERCHLPRTTAGPKPQPEPEVSAAAAAAAAAAGTAKEAAGATS